MSKIFQDKRTEVIATTNGPVTGIVDGATQQFLGIPFAVPPIGDLRWRPPVVPPAWEEPLEAVAFGNVCAQDAPCFPGFGHDSSAEDCLYLNVFTPAQIPPGRKRPVMVWIHGGGFFCGGSNDYDPTRLVEEGDIVFVSMNYRLNIFGFFSHPAINNENHPAGNYGIMDQQLALKWVQSNIDAFGGDASNVTIFGESAGAVSVMAHLASPQSAGLFHKAIIQSGGSPATTPLPTLESLQQKGTDFASKAGCKDQTPANLRLLSTSQIMAANAVPEGTFSVGSYAFWLMEDGTIIPKSVRERFSTGQFNRCPLIIGVTKDEFSWFQGMMELSTGMVISAEAYRQVITHTFTVPPPLGLSFATVPPDCIDQVLQRYPATSHPTPGRALAAAIGDAGPISIGGRRTTRILKQFIHDVYAYEFDVPDSPVAWPEVSFPYGSCHTVELQYFFSLFCGGSGKAHPLSERQQQLAKAMVHYWTTFARQSTPNVEGGSDHTPKWEPYSAPDDNVMLLEAPTPGMINRWGHRHHSDFWDSHFE